LFVPRFACKLYRLKAEGLAMSGRARRPGIGWRQVLAAVLIFAVTLQSTAFAVAAGRLAANAVSDTDWAGFELCRHNGVADDGGNAALPGGAPERASQHCVFCLIGASYLLGAPQHAPEFHTIVLTIPPWTFTAWRLPATGLMRAPDPAARRQRHSA
jgi:hypothetical protein